MKYIGRILLLLNLLALPCLAAAQSDQPEKSEIKVNKLDVIYEDEEYKGVVIDHRNDKETEHYLYQAPFLLENDEEDEEEEEELPGAYTLSDEGAASEDEILLEGFDTAAIHLPKLDVNHLAEPVTIRLRDKARGILFHWPTPTTSRPSSHYGPRWRRFHYGLDLAQPTGEPIYAAFDGVVRISKLNRSYGNLVIIHHPNGLETYYAHMSKRLVQTGQQVRAGDVIGLCGNTGRSFGSHLHFEIRYKGNAINPETVIDCKTHDLISDHLTLTPSSFRKTASTKGKSSGGSGSGGWYRVRNGDTLEKIARRNGTTVKKICQLNGISQNKVLHPGDLLRVSGSASATPPKSGKTASSGSAGTKTYTVRRGDTLGKIAQRHGMSLNELCRLNGINKNKTIREGQKLKVK
ncbi:MAG: peptidoglycan DD-metalloendopeptidase family protein [Bacteroidales bacterium]|nr:peptidoglycan DD-metalloendopeptidase family protein [Bacteroidales bacterium]